MILKRILLAFLVIILIAFVGFSAWAYTPLGPAPEAMQALQTDSQVRVSTSPWLTFQPADKSPTTGLIIYPGGRVDFRSYAPLARQIASQGFLVVIVPMPFNLAVFGSEKATRVQATYPNITHWVIGGHSLGGAMAAHYAAAHPGKVEGVVFWAAYPASGDSLANTNIQVVSVFGSNDGFATLAKIDASRPLLPGNTRWVEIPGGNHAQFGWYGAQPGDHPAELAHSEQQALASQAAVKLLNSLSK